MSLFLYWKQRLKYSLRHTEDVGGTKMWVQRDNVIGKTTYAHKNDTNHLALRGVYPYFVVYDKEPSNYEFWVGIHGGDIKYRGHNSSVIINAEGTTATWKRDIVSIEKGGKYRTWVEFPATPEWLDAMRALVTSSIAVVRFMREVPGHLSHIDFKVERWNQRFVGDVLRGYDFLVGQDGSTTTAPHKKPASLTQDTDFIQCGPFQLMPGGLIHEPKTNLSLPYGFNVSKYVINGCTLQSHPSEGYIIAENSGTKKRAVFRGGKWIVRTVSV